MSIPLVRVARAGKEIGAFAPDAIADLLKDGTLRPTDHFWEAGMSQWASLSTYPRVALERPMPPQVQSPRRGPNLIVGLVVLLLIFFASFALFNIKYPSSKEPEEYSKVIRPKVQTEEDVRNAVSTPVSNRPPLDYEFFNTKNSGILFRLTISEGKEFPYDEVIIRVTRVMGSDGKSYGAYYPLSKSELLSNRCVFSSPSGVNPYGSDCKPGDRYIIKVPKYSTPLEVVCPDSGKGLRTDPNLK